MSQLQTVLGLGAIAIVIDLVIRLVALVVVPRDRLPTAAMAWLLAIFFIPVIGVLLYLAIGSPKLPADRRRKQVEMNARHRGEVKGGCRRPPRRGHRRGSTPS